MKINDVYKLAKSIKDTLPDIAKDNNGQNIAPNMEVNIALPYDELDGINKELYIQMYNDLRGYEESDEVDVEMFGIKFKLNKQ